MNRRSALQLLAILPAAVALPTIAQSEPSQPEKTVRAPLRPITHGTIVDIWNNLPGIQYPSHSQEYGAVLSVVYAALSLQNETLKPSTDKPTRVTLFDKAGKQIGTTMDYPTRLLWERGPRNVACAIGCIARAQLAKSMGITCNHTASNISTEGHSTLVKAIEDGAFNHLLEQLGSIKFQFKEDPESRLIASTFDRWKTIP